VQYYEAMILRPDRSGILQQFKGPVLVLAGEQDIAVPFQQSLMQSHLAAETHVHFLRKTAHIGMLEEPEQFNQAIAAFLAAVYRQNK
jgi:pimeloyl-ACP methyl ester carboxylesterase